MLLAVLAVLVVGPLAVLLVPLWGVVIAGRRPGWIVAYAVTGFFIYLGVLELGGEGPQSLITGMHYAAVACLLLLIAVRSLPVILARIASGLRPVTIWLYAASALGLWFGLNVVLLGRSETAYRFLALLVLLTVPCVVAIFGFGPLEYRQLREGLVVLGFALVAIEAVVIARGADVVGGRLEAINGLDPISASLVPALGAVALVALPAAGNRLLLQIAGGTALICGCLVAGTRGAVVSLALTLVVLAVFAGKRAALVACVAAVLGIPAGILASDHVGTSTVAAVSEVVGEPGGETPATGEEEPPPEPISSLSMRRKWFRQSLEAFPDSPLIGHGVARLENRTQEARRLGTFGERIWPHNDFAEATFSLGLLGLVPFLLLVTIPAYVLVRLRHERSDSVVLLGGLFTFAFLQSNFSGEIGSDAVLWAAAGGLVAVYADARRRRFPGNATAA